MPQVRLMSRVGVKPASALVVAVGCLLASFVALAQAEDVQGKTYTQTPEVQPSQTAAAQPEKTPEATQVKPSPDSQASAGPKPEWIWGPDANGKYFLRKVFKGGARSGMLSASCDNRCTIYLNGKKIASSGDWQSPIRKELELVFKPGDNELLAEVANEGGISGFVLRLALYGRDGHSRVWYGSRYCGHLVCGNRASFLRA